MARALPLTRSFASAPFYNSIAKDPDLFDFQLDRVTQRQKAPMLQPAAATNCPRTYHLARIKRFALADVRDAVLETMVHGRRRTASRQFDPRRLRSFFMVHLVVNLCNLRVQ